MSMARKIDVNRRGFLGSVAAASTGAVASIVPKAEAAEVQAKPRGVRPPTAAETAADLSPPGKAIPSTAPSCGSDFMVDVLKAVNIDYVFSNTASSFRGFQESIVNYAKNTAPEFI